ncbi:hypothetical protein TgHK011_002999 [Trichoderma gracile]|nr:hypothetical protein TgHK011_002999 [Trichoderma gracile]
MQSTSHQPSRPAVSDMMACFSLGEGSLDSRRLRLLVTAAGPRHSSWAQPLVVRLSKDRRVEMRAVVDDPPPRMNQLIITIQNLPLDQEQQVGPNDPSPRRSSLNIRDLVDWADHLVCVPLDAKGIENLLTGASETFLDDLLKSFVKTQKGCIMVPGMDDGGWLDPSVQQQLGQVQTAWPCIRVMQPILWHYEDAAHPQQATNWSGFRDLLDLIQNQADLLHLGRDTEATTNVVGMPPVQAPTLPGLPFELWSRILSFTGDWELANALGISTNLPIPGEWSMQIVDLGDPLAIYSHELERTVLTCGTSTICQKLSQAPADFHMLPVLVVKLITRFALVEVLTFLEHNHPQLFKAFDGTFLPTKASAYFPQVEVLNYWKNSPHFRGRHVYDTEAIDGASKNGHVHILQWWKESGFPLLYTESSLEHASSNGLISVLDWWRNAAAVDPNIVLEPGRSLLWAASKGREEVLRWWHASGVYAEYAGGVAFTASRWGHANVLETWRKLQGDEGVIFDAEEVIFIATLRQHVEVLEWWRRFAQGTLDGMNGRGVQVKFRTRRIREAAESSPKAQEWWFRFQLSLGKNQDWWPLFLRL